MITNTAGTTVILNQNTTYSSATGLWTLVSPHALFDSGLLNYGRPLVGKMVKSSSVSLLPSGSADSAIYYIFKVGNTIGLAATLEDASNHAPVKFYTSGELFSFVQAGNTYRLKPQNIPCCEEPYFNQQLPSFLYSDNANFFPNVVPSSVTITPFLERNSNPLAGSIVGFTGWTEQEVVAAVELMNATVTLYLIGAGNSETTPNPTCQFNQVVTAQDFYVQYVLTISSTGFAFRMFAVLRRIYSFFYVDHNGPFLGFPGAFTSDYYLDYSGLVDSGNIPLIIFSSATLTGMILPATLTLTKKTATYVHTLPDVITFNEPYPTRGWTTNDYTPELPDSITLTKVAGYNNYEGEFTTAVNVKNYVRLKLVGSAHGWKYADFEMSSSYAGSNSKYLPATDFSFIGYTAPVDWAPINEPTAVARNANNFQYTNLYLQEVSLIRMEGIPLLTQSGYVVSKCKGLANYYLENP